MTDDVCESCKKSTNNCAEGRKKGKERIAKINFYRPRERNFPLISASMHIQK
jgi:hypothetical protein